MHHAQLIGGDLKSFIPIGMDGSPIYQNAEAFRSALERLPRLGRSYANLLAQPRFNGDKTRADWFVPFPPSRPDGQYRIVSWAEAAPDEREQALKTLKEAEQVLAAEGQRLLSLAPKGDMLLFAHYLTGVTEAQRLPAIHFPGPEYLFIVDGQPVITFWGFLRAGDNLHLSPFACLQKAAPAAAAAAAVPPVAGAAAVGAAGAAVPPAAAAAGKKHHCVPAGFPLWLRWLLGLLGALLGLFLLLWLLGLLLGHFFNIRIPFFNCQTLGLGPKVEITASDPDVPAVNVEGGGITVPSLEGDVQAVLPAENVVPSGTAEAAEPLPAAPAELPDQLPEVPVPQSEPLPDKLPDVPLPEPQPEAAVSEPEAPAEAPAEALNENNSEAVLPPELGSEQAVPPQLGAEPAAAVQGSALTLDPKALSAGDLSALQGSWQTRSGLMDANTGRPLNLSYNYADNEGQLVVRRQDGTRCVAKANPQAAPGSLQIVPAGQARCADGSSYALPRIRCEPQQGGSTKCFAVYGENQRFPLQMYGGAQ